MNFAFKELNEDHKIEPLAIYNILSIDIFCAKATGLSL